MRKFKNICKKTQDELKMYLENVLCKTYPKSEVINGDGFLYVKGSDPVLVTAHMDTVHKQKCKDIKEIKKDGKKALWSPQGIGGDDRCGIWMIVKMLSETNYRPSVLFCEDEEIGGVGSSKFCRTVYVDELRELKYLIELDRAHENDAVFYNCGNKEFQKYIMETTGLEKEYGSFSDIGHLSPACDKASVNISCGYYNQHTLEEYVVFKELKANYDKVLKLMKDLDNAKSYDYQEDRPIYSSIWDGLYDYTHQYSGIKTWDDEDETYHFTCVEFWFYDKKGDECYDEYCGSSVEECVGMWAMDHPDLSFSDIYDYNEL